MSQELRLAQYRFHRDERSEERTEEPSTAREQGGFAALLETTEGVTSCRRERSRSKIGDFRDHERATLSLTTNDGSEDAVQPPVFSVELLPGKERRRRS